MAATYRSVEVMQPGVFALVERTLPEPGPGQLRSRVLVGGRSGRAGCYAADRLSYIPGPLG